MTILPDTVEISHPAEIPDGEDGNNEDNNRDIGFTVGGISPFKEFFEERDDRFHLDLLNI